MSAYRHRATWRSLTFNEHYLDDGTAGAESEANLIEASPKNSEIFSQVSWRSRQRTRDQNVA